MVVVYRARAGAGLVPGVAMVQVFVVVVVAAVVALMLLLVMFVVVGVI
jgi:hypothetical protein